MKHVRLIFKHTVECLLWMFHLSVKKQILLTDETVRDL